MAVRNFPIFQIHKQLYLTVYCYILDTARFDVQRSDKNVYSIATVVKVDFSGSVKRIMFHYAKTSSDRDEWVEFGSSRIAPLYSKVPRKGIDSDAKVSPIKELNKSSQSKKLKKKLIISVLKGIPMVSN